MKIKEKVLRTLEKENRPWDRHTERAIELTIEQTAKEIFNEIEKNRGGSVQNDEDIIVNIFEWNELKKKFLGDEK